MNEDAADALLKDLEEPPDYAVIVLVADDLGPIPETIRSRCQLVPFTPALRAGDPRGDRRPRARSRRGASAWRSHGSRADGSTGSRGCSIPQPRERRETLLEQARAVYTEPGFEPSDAAAALSRARASAERRRATLEEVKVQGLELPAREAEQRVRRAQRGAEREELLAQLEELASWYRDLVVVGVGAERGGDARRPSRRAPHRRDPRASRSAPSAPRRRCARPGGGSRSSTSHRSSRSRRCSSRSLRELRTLARPSVACGGAVALLLLKLTITPDGDRSRDRLLRAASVRPSAAG